MAWGTVKKECIICGTVFYTPSRNAKVCSPECANENKKRISKESYARKRDLLAVKGEIRRGKRCPKPKDETEKKEVEAMWGKMWAMEICKTPDICPYECIKKHKGQCGRMKFMIMSSSGGMMKQVPDSRCVWYDEHRYKEKD